MRDFTTFTILGLVTASIYAIGASGLVVTYTTSGIFNFAHGAVGMAGAFTYWQLHVKWGLPTLPAILIILIVIAPLFGWFIDRVIMRGLEGASDVTRAVVPIGLLFALIAGVPIIWSSNTARSVMPFFGSKSIMIGDVSVSWHQIVTVIVALLVAAGLRLFLYQTRIGLSMRAVVSNRDLVKLNGGRPNRSSTASWALGSSLAALGGILVADKFGLEVMSLTLLVINAYAAAIVGRLTSLPYTFLGAVILGLAESYAVGYLPNNPSWLPEGIDLVNSIRLSVPVLMLFIVLLILPEAPLRAHGLVRSREKVPRPSMRNSLIGAAALIAAVSIISGFLSPSPMISWTKGLAWAIIMLSLVPLTGYGGQISLAQMSFAGLGAYAMSEVGSGGNPLGLVAAFVLAGAVGALVALPSLRLRGIYLALSTMAFAVLMDRVVFKQERFFPGGSRGVERIHIFGLRFDSDRSYMILTAVVFAICGLAVVAIRLGPFGRRLQAMKDSPAACATLGLNLTVTKLQVFILSAGIAGVGGAMLGGLQKNITMSQFDMLQGLPLLLMAVAGGVALVTGALFGGLMLAAFPLIADAVPALKNLMNVAPGLIGVSLGRDPNGVMSQAGSLVRGGVERVRAIGARQGVSDAGNGNRWALPLEPVADLERLGVDRPFTIEDIALIDGVLDFSESEVVAGGSA